MMLPMAVMSQEVKSADNDTMAMTVVEVEPEYPGGISAVYADLNKHLKYPNKAIEAEAEGIVVVQFVVEKDGSVTNIEVVSDRVGYGAAESVVKAVKKLKKWTPGEVNGKKVRCKGQLPVTFKLH